MTGEPHASAAAPAAPPATVPAERPDTDPALTPAADTPGPESALAAELDVLGSLRQRPLADHVAVYESLHERVQAALAAIDGP